MTTRYSKLARLCGRAFAVRMAFALLGGAVLAGVLFISSTEGAGPYLLNGRMSSMHIFYDGVCEPGTLQTALEDGTPPPPPDIIMPVSGSTRYCFATQESPGNLIAGSELLGYTNVATSTSVDMTNVSVGTVSQRTVTVQNLVNQPDFPGNFPATGQIFIGDELVSYDSLTATGFVITSGGRGLAGGSAAVAHASGSLVRAQGRLKVLTRGQVRYPGGGAEALTQVAAHPIGTAISSAKTYLTCRSRLDQTSQAGLDPVTVRLRCYAALEPGQTGQTGLYWSNPANPYWADPYLGPVLAMSSLTTHDILSGTVNDTATTGATLVSLTASAAFNPCLTYINGFLYIKVSSTITVSKPNANPDLGTFRVQVYTDSDCSGPVLTTLGANDGSNVQMTTIANTDTDGDGCTDYQELGSNQALGGLRDSFNKWDFYDVPTALPRNKSIDLFNDIFGVAKRFGANDQNATTVINRYTDPFSTTPPAAPAYHPAFDRGVKLGPNSWNVAPANGNIDLFNDIFGVAGQFGHHCN